MPGEMHAIIGPNGAGKTTLINQISGLIPPDGGRIVFGGNDVTALPPRRARAQRAGAQLSDHFDPSRLFGSGKCRAGGAGARRLELPLLRPRRRRNGAQLPRRWRRSNRPALPNARMPAPANLSHGEKRALELAIALAMKPVLLLLDEPMAGIGREETERQVELLLRLKGQVTMVLVEHDMAAVFALADRISVLIRGRLLMTGNRRRRARRPAGRCRLSRRTDGVSAAVLTVETLKAAYGAAQVLFDVSFSVGEGEMVTLLGRNGMGKTTTISTIMGLMPSVGGRISFGDARPRRLAALPGRPGRPRPRARRPSDFSDAHRRGESDRDRGRALRRAALAVARHLSRCSRASPSGAATWAISFPAASSKCWRSAAA